MNNDILEYLQQRDQRLGLVIRRIGHFNFNVHNDPFSFLASEIVGQMLSDKVRKVIESRLLSLCNGQLTVDSLLKIDVESIKGTGLSTAKALYIVNLAHLIKNNEIDFSRISELEDNEAINELTKIRGIGVWTAKMFLIFFLGRENVLPYEDGAFLQAYKWLYNAKSLKPSTIKRRCAKWKPYSSIGARYMYRALDLGLTKIPINDFLYEGTKSKDCVYGSEDA